MEHTKTFVGLFVVVFICGVVTANRAEGARDTFAQQLYRYYSYKQSESLTNMDDPQSASNCTADLKDIVSQVQTITGLPDQTESFLVQVLENLTKCIQAGGADPSSCISGVGTEITNYLQEIQTQTSSSGQAILADVQKLATCLTA